jgi:hypothetical protein
MSDGLIVSAGLHALAEDQAMGEFLHIEGGEQLTLHLRQWLGTWCQFLMMFDILSTPVKVD